ncbi:MAG: hypothetical protein Q4E26_03250 [Prevotellaceae bacterium]|nr:hypothetical protein [Prevotellaceae bacterium]
MESVTIKSGSVSMIDALWTLIQAQPKKVREALSVRMAEETASPKNIISPALAMQIRKAREEYSKAETTRCETPEEMQQFFDSL